jgi:hypothetical protein
MGRKRVRDELGTGRSDCGQGGPVEAQNTGAIYRMEVETVQVGGPGEDSGGEEEEDPKREGEDCGGPNLLNPTFVHFVRLVWLRGEIQGQGIFSYGPAAPVPVFPIH